ASRSASGSGPASSSTSARTSSSSPPPAAPSRARSISRERSAEASSSRASMEGRTSRETDFAPRLAPGGAELRAPEALAALARGMTSPSYVPGLYLRKHVVDGADVVEAVRACGRAGVDSPKGDLWVVRHNDASHRRGALLFLARHGGRPGGHRVLRGALAATP